MLIEVCANGLQSALNAQKAGADRIELCAELGVGGLTPSYGQLQLVRERLSIPIHVLIRPRSGHFTYSDEEFEVMLANIDHCRKIGIDGIVSGVLTKGHTLDIERTKQLVERSGPMHFCFHRAFDWVKNPIETLQSLEEMGVSTILSSGHKNKALEGLEQLQHWQGKTKITFMAGGGIRPENAKAFKDSGLRAIHLSGTEFTNSVSIVGKIPMNSNNHLIEHHVAVTKVDVIRQTIQSFK